jgi:hypothetical protein
MVDDQNKALRFYPEVLGFVTKHDIPMGVARWLTVVSPQAPDEVELLLEPCDTPAARTYQRALFEQGTTAVRSAHRRARLRLTWKALAVSGYLRKRRPCSWVLPWGWIYWPVTWQRSALLLFAAA